MLTCAIPMCDVNDTCVADPENLPPDGYNGENDISVFTPSGRARINIAGFSEMRAAFKADITFAMADVQSSTMSHKRHRKLVFSASLPPLPFNL